jgi:hypothetical protein
VAEARGGEPRLSLPASRWGCGSRGLAGVLLAALPIVHVRSPAGDMTTCPYQLSSATKEGQDADYGEQVTHAVVPPAFSERQWLGVPAQRRARLVPGTTRWTEIVSP